MTVPTTYRQALTISSAPENEFSRALVVGSSPDFTPSIIERAVGGAFDPLVFPMTFTELLTSPFNEELLRGMQAIAIQAFGLHKPAEIVVVTSESDRAVVRDVLALFRNMIPTIKEAAALTYMPTLGHIHIDQTRHAMVNEGPVVFPLRRTAHMILGCLDPRLLRVRSAAERSDLADACWFTVPGCINELGKTDPLKRHVRQWIYENIRHAVCNLGLRRLTVSPHEDCKAHPVPGEQRGGKWRQKALRTRVNQTEKVIVGLQEDHVFARLHIDIAAVRLGGQRLAIRYCPAGKGKARQQEVRLS